MTPGQTSKYWRRWSAVCRHNNWRWTGGRIADNAVRAAGEFHVAVWGVAENLADQACRAVEADDLRHACHIVALGRDVSHESLTNRQFNRLLLLWGNSFDLVGLLIEPLDLQARSYWDHPDLQQREALIKSIERAADESYIRHCTEPIWGTIYWRDLDAAALLGLLRKIKGNHPAHAGEPF